MAGLEVALGLEAVAAPEVAETIGIEQDQIGSRRRRHRLAKLDPTGRIDLRRY
jgi:hypothetical protein